MHPVGFGGVFTGSPFYSIDNYAGHLGVKPQQLIELVLGYGLEDGDHHWHRLERGEITMAEALEEIEALISARGFKVLPSGIFLNQWEAKR